MGKTHKALLVTPGFPLTLHFTMTPSSVLLLLLFLLHHCLHPPSFSVKAGNMKPTLGVSGVCRGYKG